MRAYSVALFVHLLGVVTFFIAIGITQRGGARVRQADTVEHVRLWLGLMQTTRGTWPASIGMILGAGLYMTADSWSFKTPWIATALVGVAVMLLGGLLMVGRRIGRMAALSVDADSLTPPLAKLIAAPTTWMSVSALNGMALAILWLMAAKPRLDGVHSGRSRPDSGRRARRFGGKTLSREKGPSQMRIAIVGAGAPNGRRATREP